MTALVTGATGFIGGRLVDALRRDGVAVRAYVRTPSRRLDGVETVAGGLDEADALRRACDGVDAIYHCAGYAHADRDPDAAERHRAVNFEGARRLAEAAGRAGARRLVFLSSVKAMGPTAAAPVAEDWPEPPDSDYGRAKRAAEAAIQDAAARHGFEAVSLRLAMTYGAGGRGNLAAMAGMVARGLLPPPPETGNRRSLVHVDDVVEAMRSAASHPGAPGRAFIVAHPEAHSGREIYDALRAALGLAPARLSAPAAAFSIAAWLGEALERSVGLRAPVNRQAMERLFGSACYSPAKIADRIGWRARIGLEEGLREMLEGQRRTAA